MSIWHKEYITNLPQIVPKHFSKKELEVGDIVLLNDGGQSIGKSRLSWPLGCITRVYPVRDNLLRCVELHTQSGTLTRPIQRLHKLELSPHSFKEDLISLPSENTQK